MTKLLGSLEMVYLCFIVKMPRVVLFLSRKRRLEREKPYSSGYRFTSWEEEVHFLRRTSVIYLLPSVFQCCLKQRSARTSTEIHGRRPQL